jgi:hypothetical protein
MLAKSIVYRKNDLSFRHEAEDDGGCRGLDIFVHDLDFADAFLGIR